MPEELERELRARAKKKGLSKKRQDAYVYGTLRETGWKPSREKKRHHSAPMGSFYDERANKFGVKE
jgi:hypothetical protein